MESVDDGTGEASGKWESLISVARSSNYYVQREGEESLTARVAYQILRDEYGALSYEQGEAAWARLRSLECTNVPGYLAWLRRPRHGNQGLPLP
ncbi:hypothetical protein CC2G_006710 [Coprinopsis cinerea AmutBmut pab1-1]|nr:hypothetical protein CC2G_006710 [Coprinopsis cinerea AmutBmut pab1-1]